MAYLLGFNNNIRCIEMLNQKYNLNESKAFNNNIRCIEIAFVDDKEIIQTCLITT